MREWDEGKVDFWMSHEGGIKREQFSKDSYDQDFPEINQSIQAVAKATSTTSEHRLVL